MSPPSLEEITAYCQERGNRVDPQYFYDYYASNGWKVGRNPMKDWKAAVRAWEGNGMAGKLAPPQKLTARELYEQTMALHRMKEAKAVQSADPQAPALFPDFMA